MQPDLRPAPKPANLWVLQGAFLVGLVMYGGVGLLSFGERSGTTDAAGGPGGSALPDSGFGPMLGTIFLALGVMLIALAFILPRFVASLDPERATNADDYLGNVFKQVVVANALLESPALLALLALMLGQSKSMALIVMGLSVAGMMLMIPRIRGWIEEYERRLARENIPLGRSAP